MGNSYNNSNEFINQNLNHNHNIYHINDDLLDLDSDLHFKKSIE
jgi:hypothetical protein